MKKKSAANGKWSVEVYNKNVYSSEVYIETIENSQTKKKKKIPNNTRKRQQLLKLSILKNANEGREKTPSPLSSNVWHGNRFKHTNNNNNTNSQKMFEENKWSIVFKRTWKLIETMSIFICLRCIFWMHFDCKMEWAVLYPANKEYR